MDNVKKMPPFDILLTYIYHYVKIPDFLGIPAVLLTGIIGFVNFLDGSLTGGITSSIMAVLGMIFLVTRIQGQRLENKKKQIELNKLQDEHKKPNDTKAEKVLE